MVMDRTTKTITQKPVPPPDVGASALTSATLLDRVRHLHPQLIDLSLGRIERLLAALDHPERRLPLVIHVAGTNGKGSTIAFLRALLEASGHRVQTYISPHLVRFHERIRLSDGLISEARLADVLARCEAANDGAPITYFEITTAAALLAFAEDEADYCLLEVGLGGRYDATNVIDKPLACVITPVGMDHQDFLGDTLTAIAGEKAGIIKPGVPVFVGPQQEDALAVIEAEAAKHGAPLRRVGRDWQIEDEGDGWRIEGGQSLPYPALTGPHQLENAALALACLNGVGLDLSLADIEKAMASVIWPARLQSIAQGPLADLVSPRCLWLDGGHNPHAAQALAAAFEGQKIDIVIGMVANKDPAVFLAALTPVLGSVHAVPIDDHNAHDPQAIAQAAEGLGLNTGIHESVEAALNATTSDNVLICGSLYLAGQVLAESGLVPE